VTFSRNQLDTWCERAILGLVLAALVFAPLAFAAVYLWTQLVLLGVGGAIGGLWLARLWLVRKPKVLWPPLGWAVLAFVLYAVWRYFTADIEYIARWELLRIGLYALVYFAVVNNLHGQEATKWISFTLIGVATATSGYAVWQYLHNTTQVWNEFSPYTGRASGTYISPNHFGGFLEIVLPLAIAFVLAGRIHIITRLLLGYATLGIAAGLTVTLSRGAWIGAGVGVLLLLSILISQRAYRWRALLLLLCLLVGGGVFVKQYVSKSVGYMQRVSKPDANGPPVLDMYSRFEMWQAAWTMWQAHFWQGVGPGLYDYRFREYRPVSIQLRPDHAHNDYLNLVADWGAIGAIVVLAGISLFGLGLIQVWPHIRRNENDLRISTSNRFAFYTGGACGLAALLVHSLSDFNLHIPANALIGVTIMGLLASNLRFVTERWWTHAGWGLKSTLTLIIGAVLAGFIAEIQRGGSEAYWLAQAKQLPAFSSEQVAALKKASLAEPSNFETTYQLGECFRIQSLNGGDDYANLAQTAMDWYARGMRLNPYDGYNYLRTGMCQDWLEQYGPAEHNYSVAETLDPNGYFMVANIGWHYVQIGDYAAARAWFQRSLRLQNQSGMAQKYLEEICEPKLLENTEKQGVRRLFIPEKSH
jgi:O-antigen ligase